MSEAGARKDQGLPLVAVASAFSGIPVLVCRSLSGRVIMKVDPSLILLSAVMEPLCRSTIFLQIDKPMPVPSNS